MKTKAFSKEGLSAAAKLDPKEREKLEGCHFLSEMVEELERQIETLEAEEEALQATVKKGKKDTGKADRLAEVGRLTERHKWHQGKLELLLRSLENGNVDPDQVNGLKENIKYYVEENQSVEFMEDDTIYDDLNLEQEEGVWGINNDGDRVSSQDTQSVQDDIPETADGRGLTVGAGKQKASTTDPPTAAARRPSNQLKSPLPALATLHTPLANTTNGIINNNMKPAPLPTRPPGETLKYASAAAAAAASDKNSVGIAPLPPPPNAPVPAALNAGLAPLPPVSAAKSSAATSPSVAPSLPASVHQTPALKHAVPASSGTDTNVSASNLSKPLASGHTNTAAGASATITTIHTHEPKKPDSIMPAPATSKAAVPQAARRDKNEASPEPEQPVTPSDDPAPMAVTQASLETQADPETESIYHLPPGLQDLIQSFEVTKSKALSNLSSQSVQRLLAKSHATCPDSFDQEKPWHYRPQTKLNTPQYYPQEPSIIIDDPQLYSRIDTDTLFFIFYYRQGTYQQYLAAKSLKSQSWRFHKQYQTWFQRHEEPKTISEDAEQGTYRFFDYESTWYALRP